MRLSYRTSLLVVVPALVLVTSGLIAVRSWSATDRTVRNVAGEVFREVAENAAFRTRAHLGTAVPALAFLSQLERRAVRAGDDALVPRLLSMLEANPGFSWVSYGDSAGAFGAAYRPEPDHVRLNISSIVDGRTILDEVDLADDGTRLPFRHDEEGGYDPRTRPWYVAAVEAGHRVWLPPYVFFHQGIAGITCAEPQRDETGDVVGVYTIDFDLGALSRFVAEMRPSEHGEVFLFTSEHELLAHPTHASVTAVAGTEDGRIALLSDVDSAEMGAFLAALGPAGDRTGDVAFVVDGAPWIGRVEPFEVDEGLTWHVAAIAPEADFLGEAQAENRVSLFLALVAVLLAVALAIVLATRISRPLAALQADVERVGRFEVDGPAPPRSVFTEIDAMGLALGRMKASLASFGRFVPRDLVRTLLASGREAKLGGELRTLSVFFSDLAGFTTLAESVSPDELVRRLGAYLEGMTGTIQEGRGTVDKYLGDGIMAFWGAPNDDDAHAAGACETALRCQKRLAALAKEPDLAWLATTATRIGVATGEVVVGNVGTPDRLNYTVMGDVANLAARIEGLSKQYGTLVLSDEATRSAAGESVIARPIDVVAVKGKAKGVRIFELLALPSDDDADAARAKARATEAALAAYLARDFAKAAALYAALGDDPPAAVMRDRAAAYAASPPAADWDGVYVAKEK